MTVAFVLGGGGILGATQVGMLAALLQAGITPDLIVGTSIGALNGAFIASDPTALGARELAQAWERVAASGDLTDSPLRQARRFAKHRTHLMSNAPLRDLIEGHHGAGRIEDLAVPFQCVAACIETARATWFSEGPVTPAVLASCAVPGMFAPVEIEGRHYLDGGLVHSIPVGRALALGATTIYVLQVGRVEQPLAPPTKPWEVGMVAFEIARRHRYVEEIATIPDDIELHVLPSGSERAPAVSFAYGRPDRLRGRIAQAEAATNAYLADLG